jgi:hypothetical protein
MNHKIQSLLGSLREAIHEALGESNDVAAVLAELEREGHSPSFLVEVSLPEGAPTAEEQVEARASEERELPTLELVKRDGPLFLTAFDEDFLRNVGVTPFA